MAEIEINDVKSKINVVAIAIRTDEYDALCNSVNAKDTIIKGERNPYYKYAIVKAQTGFEFHVAIVRVPEPGAGSAQATTSDTFRDFKPEWVFLVGIGGGFPQSEFSLGDVYLATRYHNLTVRSVSDGEESYRGGGGPMDPYWASLASNFGAVKNRFRGWDSEHEIRMQKPSISIPKDYKNEMFYGSDAERRKTYQHLQHHFGKKRRAKPIAVSGAIISANTLAKDSELMRGWLKVAKDAEAVEMELAGVMSAVEKESSNPVVVCIRGISDIVGLVRSSEWTEYACKTAASFARKLLQSGVLNSRQNLDTIGSSGLVATEQSSERWFSDISKYAKPFQYFPENVYQRGISLYSLCLSELLSFSSPELGINKSNAEQLLKSLCDHITTTRQGFQIFGPPGSGKTTLLCLLAVMLRREFANTESNLKTNYINIHQYDEIFDTDLSFIHSSVKAKVDSDLKSIADLADGCELFLFVDGYDLHQREKHPIQDDFIAKLKKIKGVHVYGVGQIDEFDPRSDSTSHLNYAEPMREKTNYIELQYISADKSRKLCSYFENLRKFFRSHAESAFQTNFNNLYDSVIASGARSVDLLKLDIIGSASKNESNRIFADCVNFYVRNHMWDALVKRERDVRHTDESSMVTDVETELRKASTYIFKTDILKSEDAEAKASLLCWGLLTGHVSIRAFCHAYHIVRTLEDLGIELKKAKNNVPKDAHKVKSIWLGSGVAGLLFPDEVNVFCKWLINNNERRSELVFVAVSWIVESGTNGFLRKLSELKGGETVELLECANEIDFIHPVYLLGRFSSRSVLAKKVLRDLQKNFVENAKFTQYLRNDAFETARQSADTNTEGVMSKFRMLQCTIIISLILVEAEKAQLMLSNVFLDLMRNRLWRDMICGFHLQYYGDRMFRYNVMTHLPGDIDPLGTQERTLDAVLPRLAKCLNQKSPKPHALFDVEMAVICSISNTQQQFLSEWSELHKTCRSRVKSLLVKFLTKDEVIKKNDAFAWLRRHPVHSLMRFSLRFLNREYQTTPFAYISKLLELKYNTPRSGWPLKLRLKGRIESVAAHSFGAMLLAEMLLPNSPVVDCPGYDKSDVIRKLLVHDISEAITGDRPSDGKGQQPKGPQRGQEKQISKMLSWLGLLGGVFGFERLTSQWSETEYADNENGKLAVFFDKLDALYQMVIYRKHYPEQVTKEWDRFFKLLKQEAIESAENLFFEDLAMTWIEWGELEYNNTANWLTHEELFSGVPKFFPFEGRGGERGAEVAMLPGNRNIRVWSDQVIDILY